MSSISLLAANLSTDASSTKLTSDVSFSTTIGDKTYVGDVTYSNGEYVASDSTLPGAEAAGSSVQAAENNLTTKIDILV